MFGNRSNNSMSVNVNSNLYISYSQSCMLKLGAWNTQLSLKFHPFKGVNADGVRQYAQDNTEIVNTSLTVDNVTALLDGIKNTIKPALEKKEKASITVMTGSGENKKAITIGTENNQVQIACTIRVSEDGKADPNNSISHVFNIKEYIVNYDPVTGSGEVVQSNSDFENFVQKLKDIYKLTAAIPHSINYNNAVRSGFANRGNNSQNQQSYQNNQGLFQNAPVASGNDMGFLPMS